MDILKYSAVRAISDATVCIQGGANTAANVAGAAAGNTAGVSAAGSANDATAWATNSAVYVCSQKVGQWCSDMNNMPWCYSNWAAAIPRMPGSADTTSAGTNPVTGTEYSGFKVCTTNYTCGANCDWVVPAGATFARFQIWGAGGKTGSGCCCGGADWGTSGAYASVIIPVVPGCTYNLCAGNRNPNVCFWAEAGGRSCASYITGYGLSNFCAEGACAKYHCCTQTCDRDAYAQTGCTRWSSTDCFAAGACICNGSGDFCFSNSCASCGIMNYSASKTTNFYGTYTGSVYSSLKNICFAYGAQVVGLPGLNACWCFDTNFYGYTRAPATYGYEASSICVLCMQGSSLGGICCNNCYTAYRRIPGAGGTAAIVFGGCTVICDPNSGCCGGDLGRAGQVCVTWF